MAQTRKNFFSRTVSLTGGTAVTLASLMLANGWSSTDSFEGTQGFLKPASATLYIGDNSNVRDAAAGDNYQGWPVASGVAQELSQFRDGAGLIDPNKIFLYSAGTQNLAILFDAM